MNENYSLADIAAATGNGGNGCNNGGFGGAWGEWILVFLIFALFGGWGNGGFGRGNSAGMDSYGGGMGTASGYVLASDFATIQRQLSDGFNTQERRTDAIINGICDLGYSQQNLANGTNMTIMQGNYDTRTAISGIGSQLSSCCCDIREGISGINYNNALANAGLQRQISDSTCSTERQIERGFFDTHAAIDKVGDRIIDYLANEKAQALRDENFALRLAASQEKQNNYLISQLGQPCPKPAYLTCNPNAPLNYSISYGNSCSGCGGFSA